MIESSPSEAPAPRGPQGRRRTSSRGNTLASFDAALRHGVDMIELDVLSEHPDGSGRLLVAHDHAGHCARARRSRSSRRSSISPSPRFAGLELDVDIKLPGYELRVLERAARARARARTLISGMFPSGLARIRAAEPALRLGWSVPRVRRDYTTDMLTAIPALAMLTGYRATLPRRARAALQRRPLRRDHGALARRHAARSCARSPKAAASSTCGPSTTRA